MYSNILSLIFSLLVLIYSLNQLSFFTMNRLDKKWTSSKTQFFLLGVFIMAWVIDDFHIETVHNILCNLSDDGACCLSLVVLFSVQSMMWVIDLSNSFNCFRSLFVNLLTLARFNRLPTSFFILFYYIFFQILFALFTVRGYLEESLQFHYDSIWICCCLKKLFLFISKNNPRWYEVVTSLKLVN